MDSPWARFRRNRSSQPPDQAEAVDNSALPGSDVVPYAPDRPISAKSEDRFQRWGFAKRVADTIARREDPRGLVVGIFGAWGEGKTSVLNLITEALEEHKYVIAVRFNPWYFTSEAVLLQALFSTLAQGIGEKLPTAAERLGNALQKWGRILALASGSVGGGAITLSPGEPLEKLGSALAETSLESLRDRVQSLLREAKRRVVVLIDDIDRLDRTEIQALFKAVRLSGDFDYVTYVLALDEKIVSASIAERYPSGQERAGRDFLEKIIQVPLYLPPADRRALRTLAVEGVDEALKVAGLVLAPEGVHPFFLQFSRAFEPMLSTPRQARRYANALLFSLPLLKGEVHVPDQLLLEGLHVFYPTLYKIIRSHPDEFLGGLTGRIDDTVRKAQRELLAKGMEGHDEGARSAVERLLGELFPRFADMGYGSDWEKQWAKDKRLCSRHYFSRYFSYAIPAEDVSDVEFEQFLAGLNSQPGSVEALWGGLLGETNATRVVERLRGHVGDLNPAAAAALCGAIARSGSRFPRESGSFLSSSTREQAAILIRGLIEALPSEERFGHAEKVLLEAEPLGFAVECLRWLQVSDKSRKDQILAAEDEQTLGQNLARCRAQTLTS
jgi:predicted KAP-like P-loop ATPase